MHKVVFDTNVFISAIIKGKSNPGRLLDMVRGGEIELVLSPEILSEIQAVLHYPKIKKIHQLQPKAIDAFLKYIASIAQIVQPAKRLDVIKDDPSDNIYLECAVEGHTDFIVSGDHHLTDLKAYEGIRIMDPATFLRTIHDEE
ncbi:putative toxin-antitoxin system toxin component, PIN family [Desulfatiglans anilini]|uniref:putative toxin-antitoxin system toxin component, PIN family n=1 Tax=Desulfatiglans anilini TaxID=90728 RepID=UPI00040AA34F|nr:putative toxin-antitoxin system toxin component, PIN family [Desulfatiglans anilini]